MSRSLKKREKCRNESKKEGGNAINITIGGQIVEQVSQFRYLGSLISEDGTFTTENRIRIAMGNNAFNKRR